MDLLPSSEQQQIIDGAASFLADRLPVSRLHRAAGPPGEMPPAIWRELADLGWLAMAIPEDGGGVGYTIADEALLFLELGRVVGPLRVLTTALAAKLAYAAGDRDLASEIARGEVVVGYAQRVDFEAERRSLRRRRLFECQGASLALVLDPYEARLVDLGGVYLSAAPCLDPSLSMAAADLAGAKVICEVEPAPLSAAASVLLASMLVGQAELARDMIVAYAKIRETFGRPIGAYQAVRHPIAEMAVRCEKARSQTFAAALLLAKDSADAAAQASAARVLAQDAALKNADDNIQLHGGIGVTDEFDAHFLIKRAQVLAGWFGHGREHLERILHASFLPL